jgi:NAD(P)-dependent dehydrogenase (short-subunit alcohol dehydrogenase family)
MTSPVALISGVGPGTGAALARRFAKGGYRVAMLARDQARLDALAAEVPNTYAFRCDVADEEQIVRTCDAVKEQLGATDVFIHNAVGGVWGNFLEIEPQVLNQNFQINTMALLHFARHLAPAMIEKGKGAIIVTGNTSAVRGKAGFAGFAPSKAAQRILTESIARELMPKGVHVSYVLIDAIIDVPWALEKYKDQPLGFFAKATTIAEEIWHIAHQDRSAWSFNVDLRPYAEPW